MENKILELLEKQDTVSLHKDIIPILFEEFGNEPLSDVVCEQAAIYTEQLLCGVMVTGMNVICVPKFACIPEQGIMIVEDMLYKKVGASV